MVGTAKPTSAYACRSLKCTECRRHRPRQGRDGECTFAAATIREAENAPAGAVTWAYEFTVACERPSLTGDRVRRCRRRALGRCATAARCARVPRLRGAEHLYRCGLSEEGHSPGARSSGERAGGRVGTMAVAARPVEEMPRPNIPSANIQLPAVRSYQKSRRDHRELTPTRVVLASYRDHRAADRYGTWIYRSTWPRRRRLQPR